MLGFWEWFTMHNNWVGSCLLYGMLAIWACVHSFRESWKSKIFAYVFLVGIFGTTMNYLSTYLDGYGTYQRHYTTCSKPEAVASFYVFDAKKERCYKPVVGFAPVDDNQVKTLTPKQMENGEWL